MGKAEEVLPEFYEYADDATMLRPDVIVVDPPRKGCDEKCLDTMIKMAPRKIVYVSCDSATLARDLRILCDGGYELKKVQAFVQQTKITYPMALDPGADIFALYADRKAGITRNVLIDKEGKIVLMTRLYNEKEFAALCAKIDELLKK